MVVGAVCRTWEAAKRALLGNLQGFVDLLRSFKRLIDEDRVPQQNWKEVRPYLDMPHFRKVSDHGTL